jgi:hypothetical protein
MPYGKNSDIYKPYLMFVIKVQIPLIHFFAFILCYYDKNNFITKFLSHKYWDFIGRLKFSILLINLKLFGWVALLQMDHHSFDAIDLVSFKKYLKF